MKCATPSLTVWLQFSMCQIAVNMVYKLQFCTFTIYNIIRTCILVKPAGNCPWQLQFSSLLFSIFHWAATVSLMNTLLLYNWVWELNNSESRTIWWSYEVMCILMAYFWTTLYISHQGRLQGEVDASCVQFGSGEGENSTLKGGRISPDMWVIKLIIDDCIMPLNAFPGL